MPLVRGEWVSDGNDVSHLVGGNMDETQLDPMLKWLRDRSVVLECEQSGRACDEIMALRRNVDQISRERDDWKRTAELAQRIATIAIEKFRDALDQHDRFACDTKARMSEMEALVAKAGLAPSDWMWPGYDKTGAL